MLQPDRRRPSTASLNFNRHEDDMVLELDCIQCGEIIRFSKYARPDAIEAELVAHDCAKSALAADLEMLNLVRCPVCEGTGLTVNRDYYGPLVSYCETCENGMVLTPKVASARAIGLR